MNYFEILKKIHKGDKKVFDISVENQKIFLDKMGLARNDMERSYKQYLCQNMFVPRWIRMMNNFFASVVLLPIFIFLTIKGFFLKHAQKIDFVGEFTPEELNAVPSELSKYSINNKVWKNDMSLSLTDWYYLGKLLCYAKSPYFIFKCGLKMAVYSHLMRLYNPSVFVAMTEYSFTSSFLTMYCNCHKVEHFNIMHGEKLFYIRDSFFRFDKCYVWNDHYKDLFIKLKAYPKQFVISLPPYLKIETNKYLNNSYYADYKYYLADFDEFEIRNIVKSMQFAIAKKKSVKYRPHPRYSNINLLRKFVHEIDIEYPDKVIIEESIANLGFAIGSYSTVLVQAYFSGIGVVLDDMTYNDRYNKLQCYDYFLSNIGLQTLSQLQN